MYVSIGRSLRNLGKVRICTGFRLRGWSAAIMLFLYAMIYLCWYMLLGTLWLMYGIGYLFVYLPIKGIIKLSKQHKENSPRT